MENTCSQLFTCRYAFKCLSASLMGFYATSLPVHCSPLGNEWFLQFFHLTCHCEALKGMQCPDEELTSAKYGLWIIPPRDGLQWIPGYHIWKPLKCQVDSPCWWGICHHSHPEGSKVPNIFMLWVDLYNMCLTARWTFFIHSNHGVP